MVKKKGKSKRVTLKQKYKIERKVKDFKRKQKKDTRRRAKLGLPPTSIGRRRNDTGIPNSWPFKQELLEELAAAKIRAEEEKITKKAEAAERRKQGLLGADVAQLVAQAQARAQDFVYKAGEEQQKELAMEGVSKDMRNLGQSSRRAYIRELKEVIEKADVILEVVDARDPLGSRAEAVEEIITRKAKKLVVVLNKVDLVPREVVASWLQYLRRFHPTIAFKAATQEQRSGIAQHGGDASKASDNLLSRSGSVGADALMSLLKNYCRNIDIKTSITVGIVGYPNVGKSSLINSLKRVKSVGVSNTPGFTKAMQEVQLDRHIKLLDSPGIVFEDGDADGVLLRNCINVDTMPDPLQAAEAMLRRCDPLDLMMVYTLPRFDAGDVMGFLAMLAKKKGKLLKGGTPDRQAAARILLRDWNTGKVPFYVKPPEEAAPHGASGAVAAVEVEGDARLVTTLGEAFDVFKEADAKVQSFLQADPMADSRAFVGLQSSSAASRGTGVARALQGGEGMEEEEEDGGMMEMDDGEAADRGMDAGEVEEAEEEEEGEEEEEVPTLVPVKRHVTRSRAAAAVAMEEDHGEHHEANAQVNAAAKKQWKSSKQQAAKKGRRAITRSAAS